MQLNQRQVDIINTLYQRNLVLANGDDDQRRALTLKIAQQICFEFGSLWGVKSVAPGAPMSKDSISYYAGTGSFDNWDWQNGATRAPQVSAGQSGEPITGQNFITVQPNNWLAADVPPVEQPPADITEALKQLNAKLDQVIATQTQHTNLLNQIIGNQSVPQMTWPNYVGRVGLRLDLHPEFANVKK